MTATRQNSRPEIESDDGASVWNVEKLWIGMVGVEEYGPKSQCVGRWLANNVTPGEQQCRPRERTLCDSSTF